MKLLNMDHLQKASSPGLQTAIRTVPPSYTDRRTASTLRWDKDSGSLPSASYDFLTDLLIFESVPIFYKVFCDLQKCFISVHQDKGAACS